MDFAGALAFLDDHVNLEKLLASERLEPPTLDRMRRLAELMGDPHRQYQVVHVTGTNGKTSTSRLIAGLLEEMGLSVGLYTSPHLESITERMMWNGEAISEEAFAEVVGSLEQIVPLLGPDVPSYFELLTAAAFGWFADIAVDVAVVEVGLGGTWDATNIVESTVAVITTVGLDHTEFLGPTRAHIAREKAGIVKPRSHLVLGETDPHLREAFVSRGPAAVWTREDDYGCVRNRLAHRGRLLDIRTPGASYDDLYLALHGAHQGDNAATALAAVEAFFAEPVPEPRVQEAFARVRVPGRLEVVGHQPLVILDGVKNREGAEASSLAMAEEFRAANRVIVVGLLRGRPPEEVLDALEVRGAKLVVTCPAPSPRTVPAEELAAVATAMGAVAEVAPSVSAAMQRAHETAAPDDIIIVTGSLYVVGEARRLAGVG